ncbi:hypothetical protein GFY24_36095 [Nocardia sp. SYP-A9097]|uniref:ADP-ribosylglycohydrolase family protein n=1 Tax=Nocardia sp. SYP-A9097 TaxID=2663237 RepID=UPI00129B2B44|nr:ADP-ribosylglycohydrolase family protein [Nocardia sp. SYP-A9097]MRH92780.1 hypothetical protein [Nocardia sp. SYP-A9097]
MNSFGDRATRAVSSMQWAAWADALGWISELTSPENLRRRTKGRPLLEPFAWQRQIGGRSGVRVDLPAGCYSDDTQLRLATARAITSHGFDVEAFSRIELPVWQSYALGGGRATKAAAAAMSKHNANWAANFYKNWEHAGGNGVAMRIQPHVYAATDPISLDHLDDVIKNGVVTHGHPNALVGAVLHAVALTFSLAEGIPPQPEYWSVILDSTRHAFIAFERCPELAGYWRPRWEATVGEKLGRAWNNTIDSAEHLFQTALPAYDAMRRARDREEAADGYEKLVSALELDNAAIRGSGLSTSVAAIVLSSAFPDNPAQAALLAAARLDTDTDTIATMAAAIVAAANPRDLVSPVLDADYIADEARRLTRIATRQASVDFAYPDLLYWVPPKSGLDSVGTIDEELVLAGLGWLSPRGETYDARSARWRWMKTSFGATMLVKYRANLPALPQNNHPAGARTTATAETEMLAGHLLPDGATTNDEGALFPRPTRNSREPRANDTVDSRRILDWLAVQGYDDTSVGYALRRVIESGTPTQLSELLNGLRHALRSRPTDRELQ